MSMRNDGARFGIVAQLFHWSMAILLIGMLGLGVYMHELPIGEAKFALYDLHKSTGLLVLALALLRIGWRMADPPPPALPSMPPEQAKLLKATHWALYGLMLALPATGWLMASASGAPVDLYGSGIVAPSPIGKSDDALIAFRILHDMIGKLTMALIVVHVGMTLKHHFRDRDATLLRMLPGGRRAR